MHNKHDFIRSRRAIYSKIFQWFGGDFKTNGSLLDYLNMYLDKPLPPQTKIDFLDYNPYMSFDVELRGLRFSELQNLSLSNRFF